MAAGVAAAETGSSRNTMCHRRRLRQVQPPSFSPCGSHAVSGGRQPPRAPNHDSRAGELGTACHRAFRPSAGMDALGVAMQEAFPSSSSNGYNSHSRPPRHGSTMSRDGSVQHRLCLTATPQGMKRTAFTTQSVEEHATTPPLHWRRKSMEGAAREGQ